MVGYYNPTTSSYVKKFNSLPIEYKHIVVDIWEKGINEKKLINLVLCQEKSIQELIDANSSQKRRLVKASGKARAEASARKAVERREARDAKKAKEEAREKTAKNEIFNQNNKWLDIFKVFRCKISLEQSSSKISENLTTTFNFYKERSSSIRSFKDVYGKDDKLFDNFLQFFSTYKGFGFLSDNFNLIKKTLLQIFSSEMEILEASNKFLSLKLHIAFRINFSRLENLCGRSFQDLMGSEDELCQKIEEIKRLIKQFFLVSNKTSHVLQINKKIEEYENYVENSFIQWHNSFYLNKEYLVIFDEITHSRKELKNLILEYPACFLSNAIYTKYNLVIGRSILKPDHLSTRISKTKISCEKCRLFITYSDIISNAEFNWNIPSINKQEILDETGKLISKIKSTQYKSFVQVDGITLSIDSIYKILNSIKICSDKYGLHYFTDVIKGSKNKKIQERNGHNLPAYKILSKEKRDKVLGILKWLVDKNLIGINVHSRRRIDYPLADITTKAGLFLKAYKEKKPTNVIFDKKTIITTFTQFNNLEKETILDLLIKDEEVGILRQLLTKISEKKSEYLVKSAIEKLSKSLLEPFLLNMFNFKREKLKIISCDYFLEYRNKELLPILKLKLAKEKDEIKSRLTTLVSLLETL